MQPQCNPAAERSAKRAAKGAQYILHGAAQYDSLAQALQDTECSVAFSRWETGQPANLFPWVMLQHPCLSCLRSLNLAFWGPLSVVCLCCQIFVSICLWLCWGCCHARISGSQAVQCCQQSQLDACQVTSLKILVQCRPAKELQQRSSACK